MITFSHLGELGRLGNQLFQYAVLRSVSDKTGFQAKIPDPDFMEWHGQKCLLKNFNIDCEYMENEDFDNIRGLYIEQDIDKFQKDIFFIPDNTDLYGFYQSTHYFENIKEQIKKEFSLKKKFEEEARQRVDYLREDGLEIVSVHMRRGDLSAETHPKYANFYGTDGRFDRNSIYGKYLNGAFEFFKEKNVKFLIFTGGSRSDNDIDDINWCKNNFEGKNIFFSDTNDATVDFSMITQCDHNITCHSTSFGWWAAYLNNNPDKIVVCPKSYFIEEPFRTREGFYPESWRQI